MQKEDLVEYVIQSYERLVALWRIAGFEDAAIEKRKQKVLKYNTELYAGMITEEEKRIEEMRMENADRVKVIQKLCKDLGENEPKFNTSLTLIDQAAELAAIQAELQARKDEKMKIWNQLKVEELAIRKEIGEEDDFVAEFDGIPKTSDVEDVKSIIKNCRNQLAYFEKELARGIKIVIKDMNLLDKVPSNQFERRLFAGEKIRPLTQAVLADVAVICEALEAEVKSRQDEADGYRNDITALRRRLRLDYGEPELPQDFKEDSLVFLRSEVARLTELKKANLAKFMHEMRAEITALSGLVFKVPVLPEAEEATEELLEEMERALEALKAYQDQHKSLLDLWRKREDVWKRWVECEERSNDPSRLNNRGGALLREEKERTHLEKTLPKLEKNIVTSAAEYPEFTILGVPPQLVIADQWDDFNRLKEEKKSKKQVAGGPASNMTMNVTRKRPMTPGRQETPATTPRTARGGPAGAKRGRITPVPFKFGTRGGGPCSGLRSAQSRDNLVSPTYSEFTNHKEIFQSTMVDSTVSANGNGSKTPSKSNTATSSSGLTAVTIPLDF